MNNQVAAIIIARPGQLRDSLKVLLKAIPQIGMVLEVNDGSKALALNSQPPGALVLVDFNLPFEDTLPTLQKIKINWPHTRTIALVENEQEYETIRNAGADVILVKGILAARLLETIEELLSRTE